MRHWGEIKDAIKDALCDYHVSVRYEPKRGCGFEATCSFFTVEFDNDEEWCWNDIESAINEVCEVHDLEIDDDSEGDFDLCAPWDIND